MYRDARISVEAYLDRLETMILLVVNVLSSHLHKSNEAMTSVHGKSLGKAHIEDKMLEM